jgi:hypothetical protein
MPKFCDNCGAPLGDAKRFCGDCGAPILRREGEEEARPEGSDVRACKNCGSALADDALFCELCGQAQFPVQQAASRVDTVQKIAARYNPVWLILIIFLAVTLFALPESLLKTGLPPLLEKPLPWAAVFIGSCVLAWIAFFLERRKELKKLGIDIKDLYERGTGAAGQDTGSAGSDTGGAGISGIFDMKKNGNRIMLLFSLLAILALFGLNLFSFSPGGGGNDTGNSPAPSSEQNAVASAAVNPQVTQSPTPSATAATEKLAQSLDGIWVPYDASFESGGVSGPSMSTLMPSVLFENGYMFMGYGSTRGEIRQSSNEEHSATYGYEGYPFSLEGGVLTVSDPYTSSPDKTWEIDSTLKIYIAGELTFVPADSACIVH